MFTLITDKRLRDNLSSGEYIRRLNILNTFENISIIVRDEQNKDDQIETLDELKELNRKNYIKKFDIRLSCKISEFMELREKYIIKEEYMINTIHLKYKDFINMSESDFEKLRVRGIRIGTSIHSSSECDKSIDNPINYVLLSPIFSTKCKVGAKAIRINELDYVLEKLNSKAIEAVALGGIGYTSIDSKSVVKRYKKFSNFAIRSIFYENEDFEKELKKIVEVIMNVD